MTSLPLLLLVAHALPGAAATGPGDVLAIDKAAVATVELKGYPDWLEIAFGSVWVSNPGLGTIQRIDPATRKVVAEVKVNRPVAAIIAGFGSVWVASRGDKLIVRIDAKTNKVTASVGVTVADSEGSLAAGSGAVWALTDRKGLLSRIDPKTNKVVARIAVKPYS